MFRNAKVGDKVWDFRYGWAKVAKTNCGTSYTLGVEFDDDSIEYYTINGEHSYGGTVTLFWNDFEIPKEAYVKPKWKPKFNEDYYLILSDGEITEMSSENSSRDIARAKVGNCFKTKEEAKESKIYKVFHEEE